MSGRERRRRHDRPKAKGTGRAVERCPDCGEALQPFPHLCRGVTIEGDRTVTRERFQTVTAKGARVRILKIEIEGQ